MWSNTEETNAWPTTQMWPCPWDVGVVPASGGAIGDGEVKAPPPYPTDLVDVPVKDLWSVPSEEGDRLVSEEAGDTYREYVSIFDRKCFVL